MATGTSSALVALSAEIVAAVETAAATVVGVDGRRRGSSSGIAWGEGLIVTAHHALERDDDITIALPSGEVRPATLLGRDETTDIAVLRSDAAVNSGPRVDASALRVGALALALARDEDGHAAALGVVSALGGPWQTWRGGTVEQFVRPDLSLYPGFSGGPLVDATGALIGMNTWGLSRRTPLTLPLATLERVVGEITSGTRGRRGFLGVALQTVRIPAALRSAHGLPASAAMVLDLAPNGAAEAAGLFPGDVLVAVGGHAVEDVRDVHHAIGTLAPGSPLALRVLRAGTLADVHATLGERPNDDDDDD